jgi:glycosyltransferase involved in cell wall biosynthesis
MDQLKIQSNPKNPKIIAYRGDRAGCWFYRLHAPLRALAKNTHQNPVHYEIHIAGSITKDHFESKKFDLAILQRQFSADVYDAVSKMQKVGTKLVYELDDDVFHIPTWNPASKVINNKTVQTNIRRFMELCDAIIVSTPALAKVCSEFNDNIFLLENGIDYNVMYSYPSNNIKPVVCWQGSYTHARDLEVARSGFEAIANNKDLVLKLWSGFERCAGEERVPLFDIKGAQIIPLVPFEAFFQMFSQLGASVGLAPLAANQFNKSKSNLKFLEYTAYDIVTVASNFGHYQETIEDGVTGILVSDNRDWYDKVMTVLNDRELYNKILSNAKELVKEKYNVEKTWVKWEAAFNKILEI